MHVDAARAAVVSVRVQGPPLPAALGNSAQRERVLTSIVDQLRALHALESAGVAASEPLSATRVAWQSVSGRPGFPAWASRLEPLLAAAGTALDHAAALALVERHDGAPLDARSRATFHALRRLAALLSGSTILGLVADLSVLSAPTLADAPELGAVFRAMAAGELDLRSPTGQASLGLALLAQGVAYSPPS